MLFTSSQCAASNESMTSALIRPRGETSKPFLPAQSRIAFSCSADRPDPDALAAVEVFVRGLPAEDTFSAALIYGGEDRLDLIGIRGSKIDPTIGTLMCSKNASTDFDTAQRLGIDGQRTLAEVTTAESRINE